jgi:hypothetical protein
VTPREFALTLGRVLFLLNYPYSLSICASVRLRQFI